MEKTKRIHYGFAAISFLVALYTYTATMQPSVAFWDCGEFAAAAKSLSIPHPPGAPLWTIVGRIALLLPFFSDPVARYNFFSVLSSAASIMLLYLTIQRLIKMWRGNPQTTADIITHYGGALIGALAYCFTDSFWFNALESEVYAFGSLFISLIPWLILVWYDHADEEHSEKWLLLIFYVIGLSMGVHQLALLTLFPVFMLVYYKRWSSANDHAIWGRSFAKWLSMALIATVAFAIAFKIVLSDIVTWLGNDLKIVSYILLLGTIIGIYWSQKNKRSVLNLGLWAAALLFMGYSTYASIMVRASQDPPMNQWHASTFNILHKYIDRDQYGETKEFPRRLDEQRADHEATWANYTSDGDFFWRYQTNHMFLRYWLWNFVGRANDNQDAGVDWRKTFGLPLILGLFGLFWHFRRDPKRAFSILAIFVMMGFFTAWYQNQQDPQPRERDYFYVGAFYAYAMWIGIGATGIMEFIRARFAKKQNLPLQEAGPRDREVLDAQGEALPTIRGEGPVGLLAGVLALLVVLVPLNQCIGLVGQFVFGQSFDQASKWGEYSRKHNNVPLEYAYNILQSCEPNAVLFTAGDNDTFPLWAVQDVYGIRRDIRIVNLSLGNMGWYIKQLKDDSPWGAKTLKLPTFTEEMLAADDDSPEGVHAEVMPAQDVTVTLTPEMNQKLTGQTGPGSFSWKFTSQHPSQGQYVFGPADLLVKDIIVNNINERPIYFAIAVPPSYWVGLDSHVIYDGLAARVTPAVHNSGKGFIEGDINEAVYTKFAYTLVTTLDSNANYGMMLNSYRDPEANRSVMDDKYGTQTYFELYGRLANYYISHNNPAEAHRALDTLMVRVPPKLVQYDAYMLQAMGDLYRNAGDPAKSSELMQLAAKQMDQADDSPTDPSDPNAALKKTYRQAELYYGARLYDQARKDYTQMLTELPTDAQGDRAYVQMRMLEIDAAQATDSGKTKLAIDKYNEILRQFQGLSQQGFSAEIQSVIARRDTLMKKAGMSLDTSKSGQSALSEATTPTPSMQKKTDGVKTTK